MTISTKRLIRLLRLTYALLIIPLLVPPNMAPPIVDCPPPLIIPTSLSSPANSLSLANSSTLRVSLLWGLVMKRGSIIVDGSERKLVPIGTVGDGWEWAGYLGGPGISRWGRDMRRAGILRRAGIGRLVEVVDCKGKVG
ncbi:hypothetical protein Tco_0140273 [Tanacetum coccineum]